MLKNAHLQSCIDECTHCHAVCTTTIQFCLEKSGRYAEASHIRLLQDCAELCLTSANLMLRGSDLHPEACGVCAEACVRCALSCEQVAGSKEQQLTECAETCRRCAQSCEAMSRGQHSARSAQ